MILFLTISTFKSQLGALLKVRKNVYSGISDEISKEFKGKSISQIRQNRDMILIEEDSVIIKLRLPDKRQRLSKKDGYRLIYLVSKTNDIVVFLSVYPKNGPSQKLDLSDFELKELLATFISEANTGSLTKFEVE